MRRNRKVLTVQFFLVVDDDEVVGAELRVLLGLAVAVQEFDWHVGTMLGEE